MGRHNQHLAPLSEAAWKAVEEEARESLKARFAARRLVDWTGPLGIETGAVSSGRQQPVDAGTLGDVQPYLREAKPLVELRREFQLSRRELEAIDRGCADADLDPAVQAAVDLARAEDEAIFNGHAASGIDGLLGASEHDPIELSDDYLEYPAAAARAVFTLQESAVAGPYAIALGPRCMEGLMTTVHPGGLPVLDHVRRILGGPVVRAPVIDGAVILSMRGGDFELVCGEDVSLGYVAHDADEVTLYLSETVTFLLHGADAAVVLQHRE